MDEHKNHNTVSAAAERTEKQRQLVGMQRKNLQRIQEREKELEELREAVETHKRSAQAAVKDSERIFTELICSIERSRSEVTQLIRDQETCALSRAEGQLKRLEQEIEDLRRRDDELEQLSNTNHHIHFLQSFQSLSVPPGSTDSPRITVSSHLSFDDVGQSVSDLREKLEQFCRKEIEKILGGVTQIEIIPTPEPKTREEFLQCSQQFTLDLNTANKNLLLSDGNRYTYLYVTLSGWEESTARERPENTTSTSFCSVSVSIATQTHLLEQVMVRISEDLIRRRAEHNNGEIFSLEEVSLHQQDIEKIEHIDKWCRDLKILYLQNNLIPKIENVGRLKKLEYLNLALNNIEVIENLEGCESLQKLDLTVNFVGTLSSVESLKQNLHLKELYLVGNPCTEFQGYRQYVVACLPQLQWLDGKEIRRGERIQALQALDAVRRHVLEQEAEYLEKREKQKKSGLKETSEKQEDPQIDQLLSENQNGTHQNPESSSKSHRDAEDMEREFWEKPCPFTPESRLEAHRHLEDKRRAKEKEREKPKNKTPRTLITADGRVLNVNEPKLDFSLTEDENNCMRLDLHVYRHMDTSLLDVDVQPTYVRVTVKGKVFQLVLPAEVKPDSSTAQRSQTTSHLLLILPLAHGEIKPKKPTARPISVTSNQNTKKETRAAPGRELLEVDPGLAGSLANIVPKGKEPSQKPLQLPQPRQRCGIEERPVSKDFVDDPEVPPLM
ncbi:hypothetical protein Q8A67_008732 [Cirrhinus molitorella]|uniref:Leucine-rich repeat-containing protein 6 n=1 Tax=Cirrhinus molitorella TaxID=172907 RepID=A0AA88PV31_9TELE|nr:hypothetical protein Q8A67_008732 [Cirrhinus molitorella]